MKRFSKEVYDFIGLMGTKLAYMELTEILHYYQAYTEACKLPKTERNRQFRLISKLELIEGE